MDSKVGEIIQLLKNLGIDDETIIFFASDNGAHTEGGNGEDGVHDHRFFDSTGGLRGQKRSLYEGGVRSPSMVRWPGAIRRGSRSDLQWAFWDAFPTIAALAEAPVAEHLDGINFLPTLRGQPQEDTRRYLYFTWSGDKRSTEDIDAGAPTTGDSSDTNIANNNSSNNNNKKDEYWNGYSVRVGNWKGVVQRCDERPNLEDDMELYDLANDHSETFNIASEHPEVVESILSMVLADDLRCDCFQCAWRLDKAEFWNYTNSDQHR